MRRSILYFASLRFVIASSFSLVRVEETRPPVQPETSRTADRSSTQKLERVDHGSRNASRAENGPRAGRFLGRNGPAVNANGRPHGLACSAVQADISSEISVLSTCSSRF